MKRGWDVRLVQVAREANDIADWLAKFGFKAPYSIIFLDVPPLEVEALLLRDHVVVVVLAFFLLFRCNFFLSILGSK